MRYSGFRLLRRKCFLLGWHFLKNLIQFVARKKLKPDLESRKMFLSILVSEAKINCSNFVPSGGMRSVEWSIKWSAPAPQDGTWCHNFPRNEATKTQFRSWIRKCQRDDRINCCDKSFLNYTRPITKKMCLFVHCPNSDLNLGNEYFDSDYSKHRKNCECCPVSEIDMNKNR